MDWSLFWTIVGQVLLAEIILVVPTSIAVLVIRKAFKD